MFCSNKPKLAKCIFQQGVNNTLRYYASTIQLPFHPHYVPPGQPSTTTATSTIRKQNNSKIKKFSKTSSNSSTTFGISPTQQQFFPISVLKIPANSMIFQLGLVPTINGLPTKREDILLSTNFFGDETSKRKIPFLFRISTICFIVASLIRFYRRNNHSNSHIGNENIHNRFEGKST